jgi:hypothetical protein
MSYPKGSWKAFKAGADLSALQFTFVKLSADDTVVGAGNAEIPHGILMNAPASGEDAEVVIEGGAKLKLGSGGATRNASLASLALGKAGAVTSGVASAIALETGVEGDIIPVLMDRHTGRAV